MNKNELINFNLGDMPLKACEIGKIIDYGYVFYRHPKYVKREYNEDD